MPGDQPTMVKKAKEPKEYTIPSRDWPITAKEASDILITAKEIENNTACYKAAIANITKENAARKSVVKKT